MDKDNPPPIFHIPQLERLNKIEALLHEIRDQRADVLHDYITKADFMTRFDIKPGLFYKLINEGKLSVFRINRKIYLKQSEVDNALQKGLLK
jgi:hypothetical protein